MYQTTCTVGYQPALRSCSQMNKEETDADIEAVVEESMQEYLMKL